MSLWKEFVGISYVLLLFIVGEEDPIGFSYLLCWYLSHIVDIVAGGFWCCHVLCLCIDFLFLDISWW